MARTDNRPALGAAPTPPTSLWRFIRLPELLNALAVSERTLYDMMARGEFPRPAKIGKMSVWVDTEVTQWMQARLDERDRPPPPSSSP